MRLCQPVSVVAVISKVYLLPLCQFSNRVPMTFRRRDRQREDAIGKRHFDSSTGSSAARSVGRSGSHSAGGCEYSPEAICTTFKLRALVKQQPANFLEALSVEPIR